MWQLSATVPRTVRISKIRNATLLDQFWVLAKKWTADCSRIILGLSTVQKTRNTRNHAELSSTLGLSAVHWRTVRESRISKNRELRKLPPTKNPIVELSNQNQLLLTTWSQVNRWGPFRRSSPNLKPIHEKSKEREKMGFLKPSHKINLIYELVRNWLIFFGGNAQLTS